MWLSARHVPALALELPGRLAICTTLVMAGGVFDISGLFAFRKAKTTINPLKPDNTSHMVIVGIYRYSRNPMYFGLLLILTGWATYLSHALPFLFLPLFVAYMNRFQIVPEERVLSAKFGPEYSVYKQSVRRWI
jgi:protein-S-isoprenylcysteine O-methyltransferase Ste14